MNLLLVYNHYAVCSGRYMAEAFTRLGHDVWHIGPEKGSAIWGTSVADHYVHVPDQIVGAGDCVLPERHFDLTVVMDTDPALLDWPDRLAMRGTPTVVYGVDNHLGTYRRPWFDHYFLAHHDGPAHPVRLSDESWLPCGYDPSWFAPSSIPFEDRDYDVAMIGLPYPQRQRLIEALEGAGWRVLAGTGLVFDRYADAYQNARVSLCISAAGDVAQRVFETAALGCLVLSDPCADLARLDARGVAVHPLDGMVSAMNDLISSPIAEPMIRQSLSWVESHTWDARARHIVDWVGRH